MDKQSLPPIAVSCENPFFAEQAARLAQQLCLPLIDKPDLRFGYLLCYTTHRLELRKLGKGAHGPIYVDFLGGPLGYRLAHSGGRRELLARAVGLPNRPDPYLIDATAGIGRDASILAKLGCQVLMLERSPIVVALLRDGLARAKQTAALSVSISLKHADAIAYLKTLSVSNRPDVVYLDPMYPHRTKSALVKKEMRVFRAIAGDDHDADMLLQSALGCAKQRVVVKRPRLGERLNGPTPAATVEGSTTRYDVYC